MVQNFVVAGFMDEFVMPSVTMVTSSLDSNHPTTHVAKVDLGAMDHLLFQKIRWIFCHLAQVNGRFIFQDSMQGITYLFVFTPACHHTRREDKSPSIYCIYPKYSLRLRKYYCTVSLLSTSYNRRLKTFLNCCFHFGN